MPPGHIEADRLDRGPARAELDAERVGEAVVLRQLPAVIGLDPVARERERIERARGRRRACAASISSAVTRRPIRVEIDAVEFLGQLDQRAVAARGDIGDDGAHRLLDVGRRLALGAEKGAEALGKIGGARCRGGSAWPCPAGHVPARMTRSMARADQAVNPARR